MSQGAHPNSRANLVPYRPGQSGNPKGHKTEQEREQERLRERLQGYAEGEFESLEQTHGLSIATAHRTISKMARHSEDTGEPLSPYGADLLLKLTRLIVEAQELEMKRYMVKAKVGG